MTPAIFCLGANSENINIALHTLCMDESYNSLYSSSNTFKSARLSSLFTPPKTTILLLWIVADACPNLEGRLDRDNDIIDTSPVSHVFSSVSNIWKSLKIVHAPSHPPWITKNCLELKCNIFTVWAHLGDGVTFILYQTIESLEGKRCRYMRDNMCQDNSCKTEKEIFRTEI
jgi:hypothetical protein